VLLYINRSIRERLIGGVGVALVGSAEIEGRIEGSKFGGWVGLVLVAASSSSTLAWSGVAGPVCQSY